MKNALILLTLALAMLNLTGCETAITSTSVTYNDAPCPLKVEVNALAGVSVRINDNANSCNQLRIKEINDDQKGRDGYRSVREPRRLH